MRYVSSAAAIAFFLSTFAPSTAFGQLNVSITNYQTVSDQRASLTQWYVTFKADLVNNGAALPGVTATVASRSSNVQVTPGQGTLHFCPVPANGRVTSADTFTILVDRSVPFDWSQVQWSFDNPVANAGPSQTSPVAATVTLDGSGCSNPSGKGTLSYSWSFLSAPTGSKAQLTAANTPKPSFVVDAPGTYSVKLTVSNGTGTDSASVNVSTVNSAPVAVAGPDQTAAVKSTVTLNGSKSSDVDGDTLSYSWSLISKPAQSSAILFAAQTVSPSFVADAAGTYKAQLIVSDGKAQSEAATVTISTVNTPPVANAGPNQTVAAGMFVQLSGAGSTDVDGDALTYRWSFNSLPSGSTATLSNTASVYPSFTADITGTYILQLIVNDGKIDSAASTVTITTNAVQAPTARAGNDVTVHAGATVQLRGTATDPQNFAVTYTWSLTTKPPNSTATLSATNVANSSFVADLPGTYAAQLVVSNGVLSSAPSVITITTTNTPPVADPGQTQSVYTGDTVYLDGSHSSDSDNDPITYSWTFSSRPEGSNAALSGATTKTPSFLADAPGAYVVQLIASDPFASGQAKTVTINVGARTMTMTPSPLFLYNSPGAMTITLSPTPTTPVAVTLAAETTGVASFSPNPVTVPANSSGVNVTVTPLSLGTTKVNASATGYYSTAGTVTVRKPSISIALNGTTVGQTYKLSGSLTLDTNAPQGGAVVTLSSAASPDGAVSFDSNTVTIPEGSKTGAFVITGVQLGTATISATAAGYNAGSQTVTVNMLGSILLATGVSVGAGKSAPLNLQLSAPAPSGGVTVTLASSDAAKLTISPSSVQIKAGATSPDTPPQVLGAAGYAGDATVTASAGGFFSDRQTIKVIASVTFKDQAVSVGPGGVKNITILLSAPAPTGGLLIYLSSSNESVATVPQSVVVNGPEQSIDAQLSGIAVGTATITLSTNPAYPGNQYFSAAGAVLNVTVARPALTISTESLPAGVAGANYTRTRLGATGGTGLGYSWSIVGGSLPDGLTLDQFGTISGTLTSAAKTSSFSVQVQDSAGAKDTKTFTIVVNAGITITTVSLPAGIAGNTYSSTLTVSGGTGTGYLWSLIGGALPGDLTLSTTGVISGTLPGAATTYTFTVQVQDSSTSSTSKEFTITVNPALAITTPTLPAGMRGIAYTSTNLTATGGTTSGYTWSVSNGLLPSGLTLSSGGALSGTVAIGAVSSTFTLRVVDSGSNSATRQYTITIDPALSISTDTLPTAAPGTSYTSTTLSAAGGSGTGYAWSVSSGLLPSQLTLTSAGVLSGTVSDSATTSTFTIQVQDSHGNTATRQFTLTVASALTITTDTLPVGTAGSPYPTTTLGVSGGTGSYTWTLKPGTLLPGGLILSTAGVISGSVGLSATTSTFTVQVKDTANNSTAKDLTITVNSRLTITTATLPSGMAGASYAPTKLTASGGSGTGYTWSISTGSLPSGLTLASGVVSGTPSSAGTFPFTIKVQDSDGGAATQDFTVTVYPALMITTGPLPTGTAGTTYPNQLLTATGGSGGFAWSVSAGELPSGLTLSDKGVLSGSLAVGATTSTFTVQVQDSESHKATKEFTVTVNQPLSISTTTLPPAAVGAAYTATLAASGGSSTVYTWSLSAGLLPDGLTLSTGGVISGTPSSNAATSTFTVQAQDSALKVATRSLTITITTALTITTPSLPAVTVGGVYPTTTLTAIGGGGTPYTWSLSAGLMPAGLTLSPGGVISGTLTSAAATSTFTVQVQDSANAKTTQQFTITVYPVLSISPASLPPGMVGAAYSSTTFTATGGTGTGYAWSVSGGTLPAGLTLTTGGLLSGTPSSAATSQFTIQVQDSASNKTTTQFTVTIYPALAISTGSLPDGTVGANYTSTMTATGGAGPTYTWSLSSGSLPAGLTLNAAGELSGTPSAGALNATFTIQVQDSKAFKATKEFTIKVNAALTITTPSLPTGIAGSAYPSTTLTATGGAGPTGYTWSVSNGTLPSTLTLSTGGLLSGTLSPSALSADITIQVRDSAGATATKLFTLTVNPVLSVTTTNLPDAKVGVAYSAPSLTAAGGSGTGYTWSLATGPMPSGLTLSSDGAISGTPSASAVTATFTVQVQDSVGKTATKSLTIAVSQALAITTTVLPNGLAGTLYTSTTLTAAGGTGTGFTWSLATGSTLPAGLTLTGGVISGTPTASGSTQFTVQVQDSGSNTATKALSITVYPALSISTSVLPVGVVGSLYPSTGLTATGGTGSPYTWSLATGKLPDGLIISSAGAISGTPTATATTQTFTVQVNDSANNPATKSLTITVNAAVSIVASPLPDGVAGSTYTTALSATGGDGSSYSWSLANGTLLPSGLTLSGDGVISGTLGGSATSSTFTVQAQDGGGHSGTRQFTITVSSAVTVTTPSLPNGMVGATYTSTTLTAAGGTSTGYTWSLATGSTLPAGLTLSGGVISGTPTSAGTSTFTVQVKDSGNNSGTKAFTVVVYPTLTITTGTLPGGAAGSAYTSTSLTASGGAGPTYTWSLASGSLPPNLTLSSGGVISGTLSYSAATASFTVKVQDSGNFSAIKVLNIQVTPAPVTITTGSLPDGAAGTAYNTTVVAVGGTLPYTWTATGLPAGLTLDTNGSACGGAGNICGTPSLGGVYPVSVTVTDSTSPTHQFFTQNYTLTITGPSGSGVIGVPNVSVGVHLQTPITITLTPATVSTVVLTITSSNPGAVLLGNGSDSGKSPLNVTLAAGSTSITVYVKALASASPVSITVAPDGGGYSNGVGTVTIGKSGFILSGPNGIGNDFTTYQGVPTGLTVYPYRLDANNVPVENQTIRGGLTLNVPIAVAPSTLGTLSPAAAPFAGGDQGSSVLFTPSYTTSGTASITATPPVGFSFSTPATGGTLNANIQQSGFLVPSGVTVGRNLQKDLTISLSGPAASNTTVTVQSSDPSSLTFSTSPTTVGVGTIQLTIYKGYSSTPTFYAQGRASSGSVPYTVSAANYGSVTASMPLGPSGFVISTPGGDGADFTVTLGGPDPTLSIKTALFDSGGNAIEVQPVAAGTSILAALMSFTQSVGTVSPTSVVISGGSSAGSTTFHAVSIGSTTITASSTGYTTATVKASVAAVGMFLNAVGSVGQNLAALGQVNLNAPAASNVTLTVTSNNPTLLKVANNATDAGATSITVTVSGGGTTASFWVFGLASSGSASYSVSMGSASVSDSVDLAPSAIALMDSPGNPSCVGTCNVSLSGGAKAMYAVAYKVTPGTNTIAAQEGPQRLAGGVALSVPLTNSNPAVGSMPQSVSIAGGATYGAFTFTPLSIGQTTIAVDNLAGWTKPASYYGYDFTQLGMKVQ